MEGDGGGREICEDVTEAAAAILALRPEALLSGGEVLKLVSELLPSCGERNVALAEVAEALLQAYLQSPERLHVLRMSAGDQLLSAVRDLRDCLRDHRAFQTACVLAPLLKRVIVVAAQCVAVAAAKMESAVGTTLAEVAEELRSVILEGVVGRAQRFLPVDSRRIAASHRSFQEQQAKIAKQAQQAGLSSERLAILNATTSTLASASGEPTLWRNEALRHFWQEQCTRFSRIGDANGPAGVPLDSLAAVLLRSSFAEASLENRSKLMAFFGPRCRQMPGHLTAAELEACSGEVDRCGGSLRNWIRGLLGLQADEDPRTPKKESRLMASWGGKTLLGETCSTAVPDGSSYSPASTISGFNSSRGAALLLGTPQAASETPDKDTPARTLKASSQRTTSRIANDLFQAVELADKGRTHRVLTGSLVAARQHHSTFGDTALHLAATRDVEPGAPLTTKLLAHRALANASNKVDGRALHTAATAGNLVVAEKLVAAGGDARKADRWGQSPLHKAAEAGHVKLCELLLKEAPETVGTADGWGATPLHLACGAGHFAVAGLLIKSGAPVNCQNQRGECPIHLAAARGRYDIVDLLLKNQADGTATTRAGQTPSEKARARGHTDIITLLGMQRSLVASA